MFWTELPILSSIKHQNLVSLVGFCYENGEKIIITRLEIRGSLAKFLSDATLLTWVQRLKISVGLAHALSYIHYDESRDFSVIHRNIDSDTVLISDNWEPKLSGFEKSMKIEASQRHHSFHNSKAWSRNGYIDPTYEKTRSVNHKSDIYSFGIVLFELLCGRESIIANDTNKYLAPAAILHYKEKKLDEITDWNLWKQMDSQSCYIFAEIAYECLNEERSQRPSIDEIVTRLEKVLELQREHQNAIMSSRMDKLAHLKIPLESILSATNNFDDKNVLTRTRYEKRYRGQLSWSGELIEINARKFNKDRDEMFWTELSILSSIKHQNLVSLVGFCYENGEKIIITRLENRGSLSNYLSDSILLTWVKRLKISVGLAHALSYIHYDEPRDFSVIHRNIDSYTVLINDNWEPKLSGFEKSMKIEASQRHHSFHNSKVWSKNGCIDPTYIETKSVNHKSDIYSFGIVLFELLCGRESIIANDTNKYLAPTTILHYKEKKLDEITDWDLCKQIDPQSFNVFTKTAYECLNEEQSQRPSIDEIVRRLEKALELQPERENILMLKAHSIVEGSSSFIHRKGEMKAIKDVVNSKTIEHKTDRQIIDEVLKSTNQEHITGVGRVLLGTGSSSGNSQADPGYCTRVQFEEMQRRHALELEELRKAYESQGNVFKQFVEFFNRQQGTPSQFQIPELYTPRVFPGSTYTPGGPSFTPAPSSTPLGLDNCYIATFDSGNSRIVHVDEDDSGRHEDDSGRDEDDGSGDSNSEYDDVNNDE